MMGTWQQQLEFLKANSRADRLNRLFESHMLETNVKWPKGAKILTQGVHPNFNELVQSANPGNSGFTQ